MTYIVLKVPLNSNQLTNIDCVDNISFQSVELTLWVSW